jgi:hypothetical protein
MEPGLRIGIDFDNTMINYDAVFFGTAKRGGLIGSAVPRRKHAVRDAIRMLPEGELAWQRLQGQVYGRGIAEAAMATGFKEFLKRCRIEGCAVVVVSHKTEYGHHDADQVNLRKAALDWMSAQGLLDGKYGITQENVYFESTRAEKLSRIAVLGLTHFIDDLEEVLTDPDFPPNVKRILFAEEVNTQAASNIACSTWLEIEKRIFGGAAFERS